MINPLKKSLSKVIAGCEGERIQVYDMMGRTLLNAVSHQPTIDTPHCHIEVYVVKVGDSPAGRVLR